MRVYRTVAPPKRSVQQFLETTQEVASVPYLAAEDMIDEIFARTPSDKFLTRFCPRNFAKPALYVAASPRTAFFEYSHYQVKNQKFFEGHLLSFALYDLEVFEPLHDNCDISVNCPADVMQPDDPEYLAAKRFLIALDPFPASIKYRSARDPLPGFCFAVYRKAVLVPIWPAFKIFQVKIKEKNLVEFIHPDATVIEIKIDD